MAFRRLVNFGSVGVALALDDDLARRIRGSALWRGTKDRAEPDATAPRDTTVPAAAVVDSPTGQALRDSVASLNWYHTIPLRDGVVTPGEFDHAPYLAHYPIPPRLDGLRVLDVATFDGYWAFEFERRGAAEVVALDVTSIGECDLQPRLRASVDPEILTQRTGAGFHLVKQALGSQVRREELSVYDLSPERVGSFDLVFCGDLLLHLMNPVKALERIRSVVGGEGILVDCYSPHLPGKTAEYRGGVNRCVWWSFSLGCLQQMLSDAGFSNVALLHRFQLGHRGEKPWMWRAAFRVRP
jgi:tRNA (mo5U34)-methyltransferase